MTRPEVGTALTPVHVDDYPAIIRNGGPGACYAADEFFRARLSNPHTRRAYGRMAVRFLEWCDQRELQLRDITPGIAARFIDHLAPSVATQKLALAALRQFFDLLVTRHAVLLNPFQSVRGPPRGSNDGKTPEISPDQVRRLLAAIDLSRPVGLRDRAVIGTLAMTGARVGAVAKLRLRDLRNYGEYRSLRFREKRGKEREIPLRFDLDRWIADYLEAAGAIGDPPDSGLFRSIDSRFPNRFRRSGLGPWTIRALLKRRLADAALPTFITPHSFRAMVVTDLLQQSVPMEDVQYLVGHSHPSTTQIYDRRQRKVTRNLVERISV